MATRAEQLREHRKHFTYALERGITPREAELEIRLQAARDKARALEADMRAKNRASCIAPAPNPADMPAEAPVNDEPWMMRE